MKATRGLPSLNICLRSLVIAVLAVFALALACAPRRALASTDRVVRVGYYENEVFEEGAREGAVRTGYAYEYYRKLSEYTGWRYEYVYGDLYDLYDMLLDGQVDLMAGLAYRSDREGLIFYPDAPMGSQDYILIKHADDESITEDPSTLKGKRIGVLDSALVDVLKDYLKTNDVDADLKMYYDYAGIREGFDKGEVDLLAMEGDGSYATEDTRTVCSFGSGDYYLCVSAKRPDLLDELNDAQATLAAEEPGYLVNLDQRYYAANGSGLALTAPEREWLDTHDGLRVGYLDNFLPFSDTDAEGRAVGLITDLIPGLLNSLDISDIDVDYQGYETYDQMIDDIGVGHIDVAFPVGGSLYYSEESGIYQTTPVSATMSDLIFRGEYRETAAQTFAVNKNNRMQEYWILASFPEAEITYYDSTEECLDAVLSKEVNYTALHGIRSNELLESRRYRGLSTQQLGTLDECAFGVEIGNAGLLMLLNRGLTILGRDYIQDRTFHYVDGLSTYTAEDFILDNIQVFSGLVLVMALMVILTLVSQIRSARVRAREREATVTAIEERNLALEQSQQQLAEVESIIADAGYGVWHIILEEGRPNRMRGNAKMIELLDVVDQDLSEEEVYQTWWSRIVKEDIPSVENSVAEMLAGQLSENTYRWVHPTRGIIYVRCGGLAKIDDKGRTLLRGYHSDVTEIVRDDQEKREALANALAAAEHANHAKTTFLNNMSHDIRTPMNAIVGFTALAASHLDNTDQVRDYLGKISVSSQHLLSLINDVLDMSRIESGKMTLDEAEVHLPTLIHDLRTIITANVAAKQQDFFVDTLDVVSEDIIADKLRLNQVLLNILSNAVKFTPTGGTISLRVIERPVQTKGMTLLEFRIKDNGIGMSEDFQKTIFEAFTREQTSTVSGIQGTGLGMAITKNIVDIMGGTITVTSEEGKGSEFVVNIPCHVAEGEPREVRVPELEGMRALVVDDDTDSCLSVCAMLRKIGLRPDWTNYGNEAVIRAKEAFDQADDFKVYIVDWLMPDLNGIECVRRIRQVVGSSAPIIILTAYDWADIEEEARAAGVTAFCSKPIFLSELHNILTRPYGVAEVAEEREEEWNFSGKHVLLVEDNEINQTIATTILEEMGIVVEAAYDGLQAIECMEREPAGTYDVILMDIQMPNMDGYEATKRIRALEDDAKASIPIIAVTANAFEEDRRSAIDAGMNAHLAKPYDIPKIKETLAKVLLQE